MHVREELDNGRIREREFFKISPEIAYGIFRDVAVLRNDIENLKLYQPILSQSQEEEIAKNKIKHSNNSFRLLNNIVGEEISFLYDDNIVAKVLNDKNQVEFNGMSYSVTELAKKILVERYGWNSNIHVNGWKYFTKNGMTLSDLRNKIERL